jgi:hypothetical protein
MPLHFIGDILIVLTAAVAVIARRRLSRGTASNRSE